LRVLSIKSNFNINNDDFLFLKGEQDEAFTTILNILHDITLICRMLKNQ